MLDARGKRQQPVDFVLCEIGGRNFTGQGVSPDVLEASAIAYLRAVTASRNPDSTERMAESGV